MANRLYVGNLPYSFTQTDLQELFKEYGTVVSALIISDRETGRSRGFGFVDMDSPEAFRNALEGADGRDVGGRQLSVTEARERPPREGGRPGGPRPPGSRPSGPRPAGPPERVGWDGRSRSGGGGGDRGWSGGGRGSERGGRRDDGDRRKGRERYDKRREEGAGRPRRDRFEDFPQDEDFG